MIRNFAPSDINCVMDIWLDENVEAHSFIPQSYWTDHYETVKAEILRAEVYVYEADDTIIGFVGVVGNYIAGLFVKQQHRATGVGTELLTHLKRLKSSLVLHVYAENKSAVAFYEKMGFQITSNREDANAGQVEYERWWGR